MRKFVFAAVAATAVLLAATSGTAHAGAATHFKSGGIGENTFPAGTLCDFNYDETFTYEVNITISPTGEIDRLTIYNTHTNLDTGYALTEVDHITSLQPPGSPNVLQVGIFWHLVDPSGNHVLVKAGEATFDTVTGDLLNFTPNSGYDHSFAQTVCPLLGGNPV